MAEYLELEKVLDDKNIITVQTKEYGSIDVIPVDTITDIELSDVQPVKHGRWLPSDSCITAAYGTIHCQICSECGADLMEDSDYDYDFCPVCGARMDLKDGDAE